MLLRRLPTRVRLGRLLQVLPKQVMLGLLLLLPLLPGRLMLELRGAPLPAGEAAAAAAAAGATLRRAEGEASAVPPHVPMQDELPPGWGVGIRRAGAGS